VATNLALDKTLLSTALELGGLGTKRETVNQALREFIQRRRADELIELFGTIKYDNDYDYKRARSRS